MQMVTSLNRIYDILDEEPAIRDQEDSKELALQGAFTFDHVSFGYES